MSVAGLPTMGGEFTNPGVAKGVYRVKVEDASLGEAKSGRHQFIAQLVVSNDPNHAAKEGKKLTKLYQSLPTGEDDADKKLMMKGIIKRMLFDGFGIPWPKEDKPFDPRKWVGKEAWVLVGDQKRADGSMGTGVVAIATEADKLPALKTTGEAPAAKATGTARRR